MVERAKESVLDLCCMGDIKDTSQGFLVFQKPLPGSNMLVSHTSLSIKNRHATFQPLKARTRTKGGDIAA